MLEHWILKQIRKGDASRGMWAWLLADLEGKAGLQESGDLGVLSQALDCHSGGRG